MIDSKRVIKENNVDRIFFYTRTTQFMNNLYTTCILVDSKTEQIKSRGVSICSVNETYSKDKGRKKAYGRAIMALYKRKNTEKINSNRKKDSTYIKRSIKLKNYTGEKLKELTNEIKKIDPNYQIYETESTQKLMYSIPVSFPIKMANLSYKYKSQYLPNPSTKEEIIFLKNIKIRKERQTKDFV